MDPTLAGLLATTDPAPVWLRLYLQMGSHRSIKQCCHSSDSSNLDFVSFLGESEVSHMTKQLTTFLLRFCWANVYSVMKVRKLVISNECRAFSRSGHYRMASACTTFEVTGRLSTLRLKRLASKSLLRIIPVSIWRPCSM